MHAPEQAAIASVPTAAVEYVEIGDKLLIRASCEELTLSKCVDIDGTILLPELGAVAVAGCTAAELETALTQRYSPYFSALRIQVEIAKTHYGRYFIHGEVASPGEKTLLGDLTLFEAVMHARPRRSTANFGRVRLIRADPRGPLVFEIDLGERLVTGDSSRNLAVSELDIIYVPPTLRAQLGRLLDRLRAGIREWILTRPILIAAGGGN